VRDAIGHAGLGDGGQHPLGFGHRIPERLLAEHGLARARGGDRDRGVRIAGRADVDDVDVRPCDDCFPVGRRLFGDTDELVNRRTVAALGAKLTPIVCIGETLDEREGNQTLEVLDRQIKVGLDGMTGDQIGSLVVAYEPVWAIGTGRNATPEQAGEAHAHIRQRLRQWFGADAAEHCHVIYGGSVKPDNIGELVALPDVDGALVGGASLDIKGFFDIVAKSRGRAV